MPSYKKLIEKFEKEWTKEKSKEMEELYNAIVDVVKEREAYRPHLITVLNIMLQETIFEMLKEIEEERMKADIEAQKRISEKAPMPVQ